MDIQRVQASSVNDVIDAVRIFAGLKRPGQSIWYRGSHCSRHVLLPSLMRESERDSSEVFGLEETLITMYRQRSLPFWPEGYPQTDWEHMFSMQHHGLATRLLDWSENAFIGLWFAMDGRCDDDHECSPILWLLDPQELNRVSLAHVYEHDSPVPVLNTVHEDIKPYAPATVKPEPRRTKGAVALFGTHNSARISAQRGVFTIAGKDVKPIEEAIAEVAGAGRPVLAAIELTGDAEAWRAELGVLGFTPSMIYPDLPGLARDLSEYMARSGS